MNAKHLELRLANSNRSLQCLLSCVPLVPSHQPKRRGPVQPIPLNPQQISLIWGNGFQPSLIISGNTEQMYNLLGMVATSGHYQ